MTSLPMPLKVAILDTDITSATVLKAVVEMKPDIEEVEVFSDPETADEAFHSRGFNSMFIDIFALGTKAGVDFIEHMRAEYPAVPICLYSQSAILLTMPGVSDYWRDRFGHYYQLPKDQTAQALAVSVDLILYRLSKYARVRTAQDKIADLRNLVQEAQTGLTPEQKQEIERTATVVEQALELERKDIQVSIGVPGVNTKQLEQLVNDTIKEATQSLQLTTKVNIGVLATGSLLVLVSFAVASATSRWEAVAFGGFGIAGVVTSLVINPLKSIGATARRLVQIQVAYLSFLSQLAILNRDTDNTTIIERSQRLEAAMAQTLKGLNETT